MYFYIQSIRADANFHNWIYMNVPTHRFSVQHFSNSSCNSFISEFNPSAVIVSSIGELNKIRTQKIEYNLIKI